MKGEGKNESWNFRHLRYVFLLGNTYIIDYNLFLEEFYGKLETKYIKSDK